MCAFEIFWNPPQGVDHGKPEKLSLTEKNFPVASILMPQPDLPFEGGIKIDATRLKPAFALAFWRQNGANSKRLLASGAKTEPIPKAKSPLIPLPQPLSLQNDIDFEILWKYFLSAVFAGNERLYSDRPSTPLQQHGGQKNDTGFQNISLLNYRSLHPSKNDIGFCFSFEVVFSSGFWRDFLSIVLYSCTATSKAKK